MKQRIKFVILTLFSFLLISRNMPANAQDFKFNANRTRIILPFQFVKNLIIVPVTINGKGPFNFILDTGVSLVIITDPSLKSLLNIQNFRNMKITGLGEKGGMNAYTTASINMQIGSDIKGDVPAAILQDDLFDLSGFTGMPIHGLIGYDFFNSFVVKVKYSTKTLTIYKRDKIYNPGKASKMQLDIEDRKPYISSELVMCDKSEINARLIIDTGAGHPISMETDPEGMPFDVPSHNIPASLGIGLSGPIKGHLGRLPSIKLGKFELKNVISAFPDYNDVGVKIPLVQRNGSIGNNILKRFDVVFDYPHNSLYLKPTYLFNEPFEYDMTGIQLAFAGEKYNRIFIYNIDQGSVADKVELKAGDEILAINFQPVSELGMEKIEAIFHSYDNRGLLLDIFSAKSNKREQVFMTLKRRI
jgi:hypothetical protein